MQNESKTVNQQFLFPRNNMQRYALAGTLFGLLFPIGATLVRMVELGLPLNLSNVLFVHTSDPLLWIINTAPIFMGLISALAGRRQDKLQAANTELLVREHEIEKAQAILEQRVQERTRALDKRTNQLKAIADVGKSITSYRDLSELLQQTTYLIHNNFDYYHVGIFMLDERREYAVFVASNSEGGKRMLENGHRLKVGGTSIVGYVTENIKARIALDVGQDAVYFDNPDLPETRSEMALPLVASGQLLGVLDVQSKEAQAFTDDDIATLQILAEQIAVAIQNANLFSETEKALETARILYGEASRDAWSRIIRTQPHIGYLATAPATVQTFTVAPDSELARAFNTSDLIVSQDGLSLNIPLTVRGQVIGAIRLKKTEIAEAWTEDETSLAITLSDQLSSALESARLYRESQQRAARESLVSDISVRISAASQVDAIIRETVQELGQAIGNAAVTFQLLDQDKGSNGSAQNPANGNNRINE
jgi:GAF domain-containing protein